MKRTAGWNKIERHQHRVPFISNQAMHAKWVVEYYNHISSEAATKVIVNGFKLGGIYMMQ